MPNNYDPKPPRVWSRVQMPCTYIISGSSYNEAFVPLTDQTISQAQADYELQMMNKGNVLQYKKNSARLTKSQKYSQLARCAGPNRTKVFATQTEIYTNPNTTGLLRFGYTTYPFPNKIVGAPNNISGPFAYDIQNPNGCDSNSVKDGGILVCGTYVNPCSDDVYKTTEKSSTLCNSASDSNVPGTSILCWNYKLQSWFPKPRYVMNNSTDKWPINYKGLVSAVRPDSPVLSYEYIKGSNYINLSWKYMPNNCLPISSFVIYQNDTIIKTVPYYITSIIINNLINCQEVSYYVTGLSRTIESLPSNTIYQYIYYVESPIITKVITGDTTATLYWELFSCAKISYFTIYQDGVPLTPTISPNIFTQTINGLNNCDDYIFTITYFDTELNIESTPSNTATVTQIPSVPINLNAVIVNNGVNLSWTAPLISCQPLSYYIYYSNGNLIQSNVLGNSFNVTGLTNGQSYSFYIKSYSSLNGLFSNKTPNVTVSLTIPDPPTSVTAVLDSINPYTSLQVNWIEPANPQNPSITYNIYYSTDNGINWTYYSNQPYGAPNGNRSLVINNLFYGNTYVIGITSINTAGISSAMIDSNSIYLTPPPIDITASYWNTTLSNFSTYSSEGTIIFTSDGLFTINYFNPSQITITLFGISGGGDGGNGGDTKNGVAFGGGGGGGGGGGSLNNFNNTNFFLGNLITTGTYITTLADKKGQIIKSGVILINPTIGSNGDHGQTSSGGIVNGGGGGGGNGGGGQGGGSNDTGNGGGTGMTLFQFTIASNQYSINFGGGGSGGAGGGYMGNQYYLAGQSCGGQGGAGQGGYGPRTGAGGKYDISSITSIYVGGGGGGGSGANPEGNTGYVGGNGSQGIVGIYWNLNP